MVKTNIADTPSDRALFIRSGSLICLTFDTCPGVSEDPVAPQGIGHTEIHDVVSADGAVVYHDIPRPKGYRVPLGLLVDVV